MPTIAPLLGEAWKAKKGEYAVPGGKEGAGEKPRVETAPVPPPIAGSSLGATTRSAVGVYKPSNKAVDPPSTQPRVADVKKAKSSGSGPCFKVPALPDRNRSDGSPPSTQGSIGPLNPGSNSIVPSDFFASNLAGPSSLSGLHRHEHSGMGSDRQEILLDSLRKFSEELRAPNPTIEMVDAILPQLLAIRAREQRLLEPIQILIDERGRTIDKLVKRCRDVQEDHDLAAMGEHAEQLDVGYRKGKGVPGRARAVGGFQINSDPDPEAPEDEPRDGGGDGMHEDA